MECLTLDRKNSVDKTVFKPKKQHHNFASAQIEANNINARKNILIKRVAYKCTICKKYHVGTTYEMLKNKEIKPMHLGFKMVRIKVKGMLSTDLLSKTQKPPKAQNLERKKKQKVLPPPQTKTSFYFDGGVWSCEIRNKTVKITSPKGKVSIPKIAKTFNNNATIEIVKHYVKKEYKNLMY